MADTVILLREDDVKGAKLPHNIIEKKHKRGSETMAWVSGINMYQ